MKARFNGKCLACGGRISVGQEMRYHPGTRSTWHVDCWYASNPIDLGGREPMDSYDAWADKIAEEYGSVRSYRWRHR